MYCFITHLENISYNFQYIDQIFILINGNIIAIFKNGWNIDELKID